MNGRPRKNLVLVTVCVTDLKEEDYTAFYHELQPMGEDPLFHIHLNVDYPFNLTGILYFPKIKNNIEILKNNEKKLAEYAKKITDAIKISNIVLTQLYENQEK